MCLLLSLAALCLPLAGHGLHPQDGPDVDVRIYVEDEVVRATLVFNLAFCDEIVGMLREDEFYLHPIEHEDLHAELFDYLRDELMVEIDGVAVTPLDTGFEVADADLTLLPLFPGFGTKALIKARITLEYSAKAPPQRVAVTWPAFPPDYVIAMPGEDPPPVQINAQLFAGGVNTLVVFTAEEPQYTWHASAETYADHFLVVPQPALAAHRSLPALSLGLVAAGLLILSFAFRAQRSRRPAVACAAVLFAGAATTTGMGRVELGGARELPTEPEALAIFQPLHTNIYRAFDYTDEGDVYDALARSVHGDLLDRLYGEIFRGLVMQEEGGAVARVQAVNPLETEVETIGVLGEDGAPGFTVVTRWQVEGAVFHWGHSHFRTNEYRARYNVLATEEGWRIADHQVLEQRRIDASPISPASGPVFESSEGVR